LRQLRKELAGGGKIDADDVYLLSYRSGLTEPGHEKSFNFSKDAVAERWNAGFLNMQCALSGALVGSDQDGSPDLRCAEDIKTTATCPWPVGRTFRLELPFQPQQKIGCALDAGDHRTMLCREPGCEGVA
jgi:hypothetical protein